MSSQINTDLNDILSNFSNSIDLGYTNTTSSRFGSVRLRGGSESRRQIPFQFLESVASRTSLIENVSFSSSFCMDLVEPLDIENEIENQVDVTSEEEVEIKDLADYPSDDLQIVYEEKHCRTEETGVPTNQQNLPSSMNSCISAYTRNYTSIKRKYENLMFENQKSISRTPHLESKQCKILYEGDEEDISRSASLNQIEEIERSDAESTVAITSDVFLNKSQPDSLLDNILNPPTYQNDLEEKNSKSRKEKRSNKMLAVYSRWQNTCNNNYNLFDDNGTERRPTPPVPVEHFGHRILIRCLALEFEIDIEPIYVTMALYDTKHRKKISENFYTELNKDHTRKLMKTTEPSIYSLARSAIFSISNLSHEIHLVIKLEKILQQGEINDCTEPYLKDSTEKSREKAKQNAKWFCDRLGAYRMPFAWASIDVMKVMNEAADLRIHDNGKDTDSTLTENLCEDEDAARDFRERTLRKTSGLSEAETNLLNTFKPFAVKLQFFHRQESERLKDEDLLKNLSETKRQGAPLKKLKTIPVELKLDISRCSSNLNYCVTTDLLKVKPYPDARARPSREILEFPALSVNVPYTTYRNLLYVYPLSVNFTNRPNHSRNITVKVQLLASEDLTKALQVIYGKAYAPDFSTEAYTAVSYHNKYPDFNEEIKIQLPPRLTNQHHLFFSFYHISCQRKQDINPVETPIGYTWIPLLSCGRLNMGDMNLPVAIDRPPPHYSMRSADTNLPGIKWVDGHRPVFNVILRPASTIHMPDKNLSKFFDICQVVEQTTNGHHSTTKLSDGSRVGDINQNLKLSLEKLSQEVALPILAKFLYVVLDKIISMIIRPPTFAGETVVIGQNCFEALMTISDRLHACYDLTQDSYQRCIILSTYIFHLLSTPTIESNNTANESMNDSNNELNNSSDSNKNYYATMTRPERNRNPVTSANFNISSSNPDLTSVLSNDVTTTKDDDVTSFARLSNARSSMMEQGTFKADGSAASVRTVSRKIFHEEIVLFFVVSTGPVKEKAMRNAWFLFEMITKSMSLHLQHNNKLEVSIKNRASCFPQRFLDELQRLIRVVSLEICTRFDKDYDNVERLNISFSYLLYDLLSLVNRTYTMQCIYLHYQQMNEKLNQLNKPPTPLLQLRLQMTRILCNHEHYFTLNLPFAIPASPPSPTLSMISNISTLTSVTNILKSNSQFELNERFQKQHYLVGLLLSDIKKTIELIDGGNSSALKVQNYSIETLKKLLASHDYDQRLNSSPRIKHTLASLYYPLFSITLQALPIMFNYSEVEKTPTSTGSTEDGIIRPSIANAIANPFNQISKGPRTTNGKLQMTATSTRDLLVCFFWLLKNTEPLTLKSWWGSLPCTHILLLLEVLHLSLSCFELKRCDQTFGRRTSSRSSINFGASNHSRHKNSKSRLEGVIRGENSARQEMLNRRRAEKGGTLKDGLRWNKNQTEWKQNKENGDRSHYVIDDSPHARCFSSETSMMTLDAIELVVESMTESRSLVASQTLSSCFRVLLQLFSKPQSVDVLENAFRIQRNIVAKFPDHLFEEDTDQCGDLSSHLLQKCSSRLSLVRRNATASLYLLMRYNHSIGNSFSKVRMQITMSMSSLVGVAQNFDEFYLRRSLKTILSYSEKDLELQRTSFPDQVRDLILNLHTILSDTVKMKEHQEDPEMLIDLMYRIAKGYQTSPNLRLTWLQNMAAQHIERKNDVEAGMCYLHCAGLVSEYLALIEYKSYLPTGCAGFQNITDNILEESVISDDIITSSFGEMSTDKFFSIPGLTQLLEKAIISFGNGGLYEVVSMVSQHVERIYQHQKNFAKLKEMHSNLQKSFNKISTQNSFNDWEIGKRMFGTYFRVAFYGSKFGDLNGEQFIYKEPAITKLPEISQRLLGFYSKCFGEKNVSVLKDSSEVNVENLDAKKAYIQITYVEPYFYEYEDRVKKSYFERNFNMDKFVYATPFTEDGKAHGEIKDQFKRKTYLQVSNSFPYVKTRVNVVRKWERVLTPLESACEDIKRKTSDLLRAVNMKPPDSRMLQINLQGAVLTAVNQGPMEVANTFLGEVPEDLVKCVHLNEMRLAFKKFLHVCSVALKANKKLIKSDQLEYQREMDRNYHKMSEQLRPLLANRKVVEKIQECHHKLLQCK